MLSNSSNADNPQDGTRSMQSSPLSFPNPNIAAQLQKTCELQGGTKNSPKASKSSQKVAGVRAQNSVIMGFSSHLRTSLTAERVHIHRARK